MSEDSEKQAGVTVAQKYAKYWLYICFKKLA